MGSGWIVYKIWYQCLAHLYMGHPTCSKSYSGCSQLSFWMIANGISKAGVNQGKSSYISGVHIHKENWSTADFINILSFPQSNDNICTYLLLKGIFVYGIRSWFSNNFYYPKNLPNSRQNKHINPFPCKWIGRKVPHICPIVNKHNNYTNLYAWCVF